MHGTNPRTTASALSVRDDYPDQAKRDVAAPWPAASRRWLFVFGVHFLRKLGGLDTPLLFKLLNEAGLVPVGRGFRHEVDQVFFTLLDCNAPGYEQDRIKRHFIRAPFGLQHF